MTAPALSTDVVVIGGGISGLATAFRLKKQGLRVLLLEKSARLGGSIQTETEDGFLIDAGPSSTLDTSPEIRDLLHELDLSGQRVNANDRASRRYILKAGRLKALPMSPPAFLRTDLFSLRAKLRLLREPFIAPAASDEDESLAAFVERRLGREFLDYAINPFTAGVYAGDPRLLSVKSAFRKIYDLEQNYGSLIKGAIKGAKARKQRADIAKDRAQLFSFRGGMQELVKRLEQELQDNLNYPTTAEQIESVTHDSGKFSIPCTHAGASLTVTCNAVVLTTPAYVSAQLLSPFQASPATALNGIKYPPVAVVFLGFKKAAKCRPLDGFGFLVPEVEQRKILGTIWSSVIFPDRAPDGGVALTTFVGGMRQPEIAGLEDDELLAVVLQELKDIMQLAGVPDVVKIKRWPKAIPQYEIGHAARIAAIEDFERQTPGLFVAGNFRSGISVGDCIVASRMTAAKVAAHCKSVEQEKV